MINNVNEIYLFGLFFFIISGFIISKYIKDRQRTTELNITEKTPQVKNNLTQKLTPYNLVIGLPKVKLEDLYSDRSPWKDRVIELPEKSTEENSWFDTIRKLKDDLNIVLKYMSNYWSPYWFISTISCICLMSLSAYQLFFSQILGIIVDQGASTMINSVIKLAVGLPLSLALILLGERIAARLTSRIANDIRYDLFKHLQILSQDFHKNAKLGDLLAHFSTDMQTIERSIGKEFVLGIGELILMGVILGIMIKVNLYLAIISLLPLIFMLPILASCIKYVSQTGVTNNQQTALMMDALQEGVRGIMLIYGYGLQSIFNGFFSSELKKLEDTNTEGLFAVALVQQLSLFSIYLISILVLGVGTSFVVSGKMTIGTLLAFWGFSRGLYDRLSWFVNVRLTRWIEASVGMQRIEAILQEKPTIVDMVNAHSLSPFQHQLSFENVYFGYECEHQLQNLNLTIKAGEFVAFVGPSGAGKSTIFNLLMRFYDVSSGKITIDGDDIKEVTQESLRQQIGIVLQDTFLFNTTIMNNISIVKTDATEEEVIIAAKSAELHDFILSLPEGYQTIVGEGGGKLSGGQRQRIAIARSLLYKPSILLLDEPTSSLSPEMANAINQVITALAGKHTIILITHQLEGVINADQIFVLDQGKLVERGTHPELLNYNGLYRYLWDIQ